jgi:hypothetical protein
VQLRSLLSTSLQLQKTYFLLHVIPQIHSSQVYQSSIQRHGRIVAVTGLFTYAMLQVTFRLWLWLWLWLTTSKVGT